MLCRRRCGTARQNGLQPRSFPNFSTSTEHRKPLFQSHLKYSRKERIKCQHQEHKLFWSAKLFKLTNLQSFYDETTSNPETFLGKDARDSRGMKALNFRQGQDTSFTICLHKSTSNQRHSQLRGSTGAATLIIGHDIAPNNRGHPSLPRRIKRESKTKYSL